MNYAYNFTPMHRTLRMRDQAIYNLFRCGDGWDRRGKRNQLCHETAGL